MTDRFQGRYSKIWVMSNADEIRVTFDFGEKLFGHDLSAEDARLLAHLLMQAAGARVVGEELVAETGMSDDEFRDECAMRAMQALMGTHGENAVAFILASVPNAPFAEVARLAYDGADAMVAERARRQVTR